jgi:hypothetical protein
MNWDKLLPAVTGLLGVLVGSLTLLFAGWTESQRQTAIKRYEALVQFAEAIWGTTSEADMQTYKHKIGGLTVFADKGVLDAYAPYARSGCALKGDPTYECRSQWANVVNAMRKSAEVERADPDTIIYILWGDLGQK